MIYIAVYPYDNSGRQRINAETHAIRGCSFTENRNLDSRDWDWTVRRNYNENNRSLVNSVVD